MAENPQPVSCIPTRQVFERKPKSKVQHRPILSRYSTSCIACQLLPLRQPSPTTLLSTALGDPKQSPGGVADGQKAHRTLLLKASIGLRAPTTSYMPHEIPEVFHMLLRHGRGFGLFFHEYGRRVGMVPRSSLKEGKKRQMVEKGTKTPKNQPKTKHPSPQADSTIL